MQKETIFKIDLIGYIKTITSKQKSYKLAVGQFS